MVLNRNSASSAARSGDGTSVRSAKPPASARCAPARICAARYAGSPRASSHAASGAGAISLMAGAGPAMVSSVTTSEDEPRVVQERQQRGERTGDVRPGGGLEHGARAVVALAGHTQGVHEGQRLARRADLDRQG